MNIYSSLGIAAAIVTLYEGLLYIISIFGFDYRFKKITRTQPSRATWTVWAALGIVTALSYAASGATSTIWVPMVYAGYFTVIALLSIPYGYGGWNRWDLLCIFGALCAALIWWQFNSPQIALYMTILIDTLGLIPTILKSYANPRRENLLAWNLAFVASILNILAVQWSSATFAIVIYPLYMVMGNGLIASLLYLRKT